MKKSGNRGVSLIEILIAVAIFVICITPIIGQLLTSIRVGQNADDQQAATDYGKSLTESINSADLDVLINVETGVVDKSALAKLLQMDDSTIVVSYELYSIKKDASDGISVVKPAVGETCLGKYLDLSGNYVETNSITKLYQVLNSYNSSVSDEEDKEALVREYKISGKTDSAGIDYRHYDVDITFNNKGYALAALNGKGYSVYDDATDTYVYTDPNAVNLGNLSILIIVQRQ